MTYIHMYMTCVPICTHVGIVLPVPQIGSMLCLVALLGITVDLPARAAVADFIQYSAPTQVRGFPIFQWRYLQ